MRILHVVEPADGGAARHVRDLAAGQVAAGHPVQAVVSQRGWLADELWAVGAGVIRLDLRPEITALGSDLRAARALARLLRAGRWDIVHTHGNKAGTIARPLAALAGLPVVHTPHSFAYASQRYRPRPGQRARRALTLAIEQGASRFARVIICVSEAEREEAIGDRVADPRKLVVVPNGVAAPESVEPDPRLLDGGSGPPLVGFLARLHPGKGPQLLLDALLSLRARGVPFRAALVGDGPLGDEVRRRVADDGLADAVRVLPFPGQVWPVLAAFDVYVLPTLWESMPIGVLEAMAVGLPVVAADTGGIPEAVLDGETGLLHPPGDAAALAAALERMLLDAQMRQRMGAAGRRRQAAGYSLEAMIAGTARAYERALDG
jgi:glycosyltransferase involved in cell wall biosynthesis